MMNEENLRLTSTTADTVSSKNPGWILKVVPNMRWESSYFHNLKLSLYVLLIDHKGE